MSGNKVRLFSIAALFMAGLAGCHVSPQAKEAKFLKRAEALVAKKDYSRAVLELQNAAKAVPKDAEPYYRIGLVDLKTQNYEAAVKAFQKALQLNPRHAPAEVKLAELMETSRDQRAFADAESLLRGAMQNGSNDAETFDALALAEFKLGKPGDATRLLDQALQNAPQSLESANLLARMKLHENDSEGAVQTLKKAVASAPKSPQAALALGRLYMQLDRPGEAETQFRAALALDSGYAPALYSLALMQMKARQMDAAEQTYKQLAVVAGTEYKEYVPLYGAYLFDQAKRDAALVEFQKFARQYPDDRAARTRLFMAYVTMNKMSEAEALLRDALGHNAKDIDALLQRAELRVRAGDAADAEKDINQVLRFAPNLAAAHYELARIRQMQGLNRSGRQELASALVRDANFLPARLALARSFLLTNEAQAALQVMDETPERQKDIVQAKIQRNWALLEAGNLTEAGQRIGNALAISRDPELLEQRGLLKMKEKDFVGARSDAEEILNQNPENERAIRLLVDSYARQNQLPTAVEKVRELASRRPNSAFLEFILGQLLVSSGNEAEGRKAFEKATAIDQKFALARLALADQDMKVGKPDSARQNINAVLKSDPRNILALRKAADIEYFSGAPAAAIVKYRALLEVDGANPGALNNLARLLTKDDPDEALKLAQQTVEIAPEDPGAQDTLGWIYYRKGLYSAAVKYLKLAASRDPTPILQYHLGLSYLKTGEKQLGQRMLAVALKRDPNLPKTNPDF
jgi:tetratricopeptide (TPR) repeat protein